MTTPISRRSVIARAAAGLAIGVTPAVIATPSVGQKAPLPHLTERFAKAIARMRETRQLSGDLFKAVRPGDHPGPYGHGPSWDAYFDAKCEYDAAVSEVFWAMAEQPLSALDEGQI